MVAEPEDDDAHATGHLKDADRVIATLRPRFRNCYERGLARDNHRMSGKMMLVTRVSEDGTVRSAKVSANQGLSAAVAECVADQMRRAVFRPPGNRAKLEVPVHFRSSN